MSIYIIFLGVFLVFLFFYIKHSSNKRSALLKSAFIIVHLGLGVFLSSVLFFGVGFSSTYDKEASLIKWIFAIWPVLAPLVLFVFLLLQRFTKYKDLFGFFFFALGFLNSIYLVYWLYQFLLSY